jgi:2-C-methyl-D-erythritol 4-phosphate cytidylyltransferase / 2-C-methyl-D-erythritol 2,4-cyclodiphosphate synthase
MSTPPADVVIVAAGASTRMGGLDKMTVAIGGRPLLAWTLAPFAASPLIDRLVVVAPADRIDELGSADWLPRRARVVAGGERRQQSVAAGVAVLAVAGAADDRIILIHDGARPAVSQGLIEQIVAATAAHGAAIPAVPVVETLKRVADEKVAGTVVRDDVVAAQTPQGVRLDLLRSAYGRFSPDAPETFTDEAALLEACTIPVHVVRGEPDNLKVTIPADLDRAASILGADVVRVGYGDDSHPFGPGEPLAIGGVAIAGAPRLSGHSDGDVVLHAVADALLGAGGLTDLGRLFPADGRTPRGVDSGVLLADVVGLLAANGATPRHLDVTIVAARPHLGPHLDAIRARVAGLAGLPIEAVNVKASTGNLAGMEGAGRGISARVVATVDRAR